MGQLTEDLSKIIELFVDPHVYATAFVEMVMELEQLRERRKAGLLLIEQYRAENAALRKELDEARNGQGKS